MARAHLAAPAAAIAMRELLGMYCIDRCSQGTCRFSSSSRAFHAAGAIATACVSPDSSHEGNAAAAAAAAAAPSGGRAHLNLASGVTNIMAPVTREGTDGPAAAAMWASAPRPERSKTALLLEGGAFASSPDRSAPLPVTLSLELCEPPPQIEAGVAYCILRRPALLFEPSQRACKGGDGGDDLDTAVLAERRIDSAISSFVDRERSRDRVRERDRSGIGSRRGWRDGSAAQSLAHEQDGRASPRGGASTPDREYQSDDAQLAAAPAPGMGTEAVLLEVSLPVAGTGPTADVSVAGHKATLNAGKPNGASELPSCLPMCQWRACVAPATHSLQGCAAPCSAGAAPPQLVWTKRLQLTQRHP